MSDLLRNFPTLTEEECDRLQKFFADGAAKFSPKDAYWIDGADAGDDYCLPCAERELVKDIARYRRLPKKDRAKAERPSLGGGYSTEHDGPPFCATCGAVLDGSLTDYGAEEEVSHFTTYGFDIFSDDDRRAMSEVISARRWRAWSGITREYEQRKAEEYFTSLHELGRKILAMLDDDAQRERRIRLTPEITLAEREAYWSK